MSIFKKIKSGIQTKQLNKVLKKPRPKLEFHNFDTAESLCVLFNAESTEDYLTTETFMNEMKSKGKEVQLVGFVSDNSDNLGFDPQDSILFISEKDCNKIGVPKTKILEEIFYRQHDIFINFCFEDSFILKYITAYSNAEFKISGIPNDQSADFVIDMGDNKSIKEMIKQTRLFLDKIIKA